MSVYRALNRDLKATTRPSFKGRQLMTLTSAGAVGYVGVVSARSGCSSVMVDPAARQREPEVQLLAGSFRG